MSDLGPGMSYVFTPEWHAQIGKDRKAKKELQDKATAKAESLGHSLYWHNVGLDFAHGECRCGAYVNIGVGAPLKGFTIGIDGPAVRVNCQDGL